jgi:nucleotide-binding universal stress UspA family protein
MASLSGPCRGHDLAGLRAGAGGGEEEHEKWASAARAQGMIVRTGSAHEEIVNLATDERADLIVMGTHGRTGLNRVLLGSVADRVIRFALCPVLTVRKPE